MSADVNAQLVEAGAVKGGGGWWTLPVEGDDGQPVRVQGAEKALAALEDAGVSTEPEGVAEDPPEVSRVDDKFVTVQAPSSWARNNWQPSFLTEPLRFNRDARARLRVENAGDPIVFEFMGPQGLEQIPVADKVAEHPDLEVTE